MITCFTHRRTRRFRVVLARETEPASSDDVGSASGIGHALPSMSMTEVVLVVPPPPACVSSVVSRLQQTPEGTASRWRHEAWTAASRRVPTDGTTTTTMTTAVGAPPPLV